MPDWYNDLARFYDAENQNFNEDLALYSALLDEVGGPVLDVGCGTGRVALHLAAAGARVVGLDISGAMLKRAQARLAAEADLAARVAFHETSITEYESDTRFGLAVVAYNGFMHLRAQVDQLAALRHIAAALRDDGLLVIDLPNAGEAYATHDEISLVFERTFTDPETGHLVMQQSVSQIDRAAQTLSVTWIYDAIDDEGVVRRTLVPLELRYTFAAEMDLLLKQAGLERLQLYGDYDRSPVCGRLPAHDRAGGEGCALRGWAWG
ncbi:MAG: class I SAM-dependent methyltransferase [Anaerolineae bacterium]|nr:class I SAM-dependent methyltransferase [Anaerolineae bacterium]